MACIFSAAPGWAVVSFPFFFFFNDTATTEIYTLSLHDALPISRTHCTSAAWPPCASRRRRARDRKSTRLNSSHRCISYAVFCLKKKKKYYEERNDRKKKQNNHHYKSRQDNK